jgi:hypothetical protein
MTTIEIKQTEEGYSLFVNNNCEILNESFPIVDQVRDALAGKTSGIMGECKEVAKAIKEKYRL